MILLLIASIVAAVAGILIFLIGDDFFSLDWLFHLIGGVTAFVGCCGLIAVVLLAFKWQGAGVKAAILNREYGTNYTKEEVFYASDTIDIVRELDRKRIEVNGDLLREKKD